MLRLICVVKLVEAGCPKLFRRRCDKMKILLIILGLFANSCLQLQQYCNDNALGHFYRKITKNSHEENNAHEEDTLNPKFFDCGIKDSCTHVVMFQDTNTYEIVHGEADLKSIKRPIKVWEKQDEKPNKEWIVIQRRIDGSVDFARNWTDYKMGFGNPCGDFWIGLEKMHSLAGPGKGAILNITMKHWANPNKLFYAAYTKFEIGNECDGYRLNVGGYSGNAGDSLAHHSGKKFSTDDRDNDRSPWSCASKYKAGWWYDYCFLANLNNVYHKDSSTSEYYMSWWNIAGSFGNIFMSEMKIQVSV